MSYFTFQISAQIYCNYDVIKYLFFTVLVNIGRHFKFRFNIYNAVSSKITERKIDD